MLRGQKGITLVALVVTIIVLIILAGISVSLLLGNNGLIDKAKTAGNIQVNASADENARLTNAEAMINNMWKTYVEDKTQQ